LSNKKWQNKNKEGWFYFLKKIKLAVKCPFLPTLKKQTLGRNFRALSESDKHLSDKYRDPLDAKRL